MKEKEVYLTKLLMKMKMKKIVEMMLMIMKRDEKGIVRIVGFRSTDFLDLPEKNVPI